MQGEGSWGNVRFRPRRLRGGVDWGDAESRFVTGLVVFLLTALLYPWYAYRVQAWLLERDLAAATQALAQASAAQMQASRQRAAVATRRAQVASVPAVSIRIMGAMELRNGPMAIVDLAGRPLDGAAPVICLRVQETLGTPMVGRALRVQRWRPDAPAVSMGSSQC